MLSLGILAQDKTPATVPAKPEAAPALKDSIAIDLHTRRESLLEIEVQALQMQLQIDKLRAQQAQMSGEYQKKFDSALKDSGLDETKYDLDRNTLAVKLHDILPPAPLIKK